MSHSWILIRHNEQSQQHNIVTNHIYQPTLKTTGCDSGLKEHMTEVDKIPCVIGATRLYRTLYDLADHEIVLAATGYKDILIILDTVNGKVSEIGYDGRKCIASSFEIWRRSLKKPDKTIS